MLSDLAFLDRASAIAAIAAWWRVRPEELETYRAPVPRANFAEGLRDLAPGLVELADGGWVAVAESGVRGVRVLDRGGKLRPIRRRDLMTQPPDKIVLESQQLADLCGVSGRRRDKLVAQLVAERLGDKSACRAWRVRAMPAGNFKRALLRTGIRRQAVFLVLAHLAAIAVMISAWWAAGRGILSGRLDPGWLAAWALGLATWVPLRLATTWLAGRVAIGAGGLLKERLLTGALSLDPDRMRRLGAGQLLSQAIEAENIEQLALGGGIATVLALPELAAAFAVLALGTSPLPQLAVFVGWLAAAALIAARYAIGRDRWTRWRLAITHRLVERMTGHRTRLAQEAPEDWHTAEDEETSTHATLSRAMDRAGAALSNLMPRAYPALAVLALTPTLTGATLDSQRTAVTIGGILLGYQALRRLGFGLSRLASAWVSWRQMRPLFDAAQPPEPAQMGDIVPASETVLEATGLVYRHAGRQEATVQGGHLKVRRGDFVLVEGASGSGKSTFASLLAGLREPASGSILASGYDRRTLGDSRWRRRIAAAPQYHENYLISAPLAFNLLMGRGWPPRAEDLAEAEEICQELGLGPLLERMPGGLMTMVGETGWQLSQGERSRVFLARALLQGADVVLLDESFAALDPLNLRQCLECVFTRAESLVVIAHP